MGSAFCLIRDKFQNQLGGGVPECELVPVRSDELSLPDIWVSAVGSMLCRGLIQLVIEEF